MRGFLFAALALLVAQQTDGSRLLACGEFGCYEERVEVRFGLSDMLENADEWFVRSDAWDAKTIAALRKAVSFNLYYNPKDNSQFETATVDSKPIFKNFQPSLMTKVIIHGWQNNLNSPIGQNIKNAYIKSGAKANLIVVDWSEGSKKFYNRAKACVPFVADIVAELITRLVDEQHLDVSRLHIIGHSLGAHVSGLTGTRLRTKPARVTGLDPARPTFDNDDTEKISVNSGKFVDIIHSCANRLGLARRLGHIDFYPNRGEGLQLGCQNDFDGACSHARSHEIYAESLTSPKGFKGTQCSDWEAFKLGKCAHGKTLYIGEEIPKKYSEGSYFLKTASTAPFGLGEKSTSMTEEDIKQDENDSTVAKMLFTVI